MSGAMDTNLSETSDSGAARGSGAHKSVRVNGEERLTQAISLADLLEETGYGSARVATAVNGAFVPARMREGTVLAEGDAIEVVAPRQGG